MFCACFPVTVLDNLCVILVLLATTVSKPQQPTLIKSVHRATTVRTVHVTVLSIRVLKERTIRHQAWMMSLTAWLVLQESTVNVSQNTMYSFQNETQIFMLKATHLYKMQDLSHITQSRDLNNHV